MTDNNADMTQKLTVHTVLKAHIIYGMTRPEAGQM